MATRSLDNYIRGHRKRGRLSQDELAYLIGFKSTSPVSRCERFERIPDLESAFAYAVIFRVPIEQLFAGVLARVEERTMQRVGIFARTLMRTKDDPLSRYKLDFLAEAVRAWNPKIKDDEGQ